MKYYEMHEVVYKKLKEKKLLSWDRSETFEQMWSHHTNVYLSKLLKNKNKSLSGLRVLDLGTGTGTSALYCAKEGASAVGVEISASALDIAKSNALKLELDVEFLQRDVLELDLNEKFDIVIDSTILHCLVGKKDRSCFYDVAKSHMKKSGYCLINTMIATDAHIKNYKSSEHFVFQDDVLWSLGISEISKRKAIDGKSYFPHRTILTKEKQLEEFFLHQLKVEEFELVTHKDSTSLVALLKF